MPLTVSAQPERFKEEDEPGKTFDAMIKHIDSQSRGYDHSTDEEKEAYLHMVQEVCILLVFSIVANAVIVSSLCAARDVAHSSNKECKGVVPYGPACPNFNDGMRKKSGRKDKARKGVIDSYPKKRDCLTHARDGKDAQPAKDTRAAGHAETDQGVAADMVQSDAAACGGPKAEAPQATSIGMRYNILHGIDSSSKDTNRMDRSSISAMRSFKLPNAHVNQGCIVWDLPQLKAVLANQHDTGMQTHEGTNVPLDNNNNNISQRNMMLAALCKTDAAFAFFPAQAHASAAVTQSRTWASSWH